MSICQKLGTILLKKYSWQWFILKMLFMKVVLQSSFQIRKSFTGRSNWILASTIDSKNWKCVFFYSPQKYFLQDVKKSFQKGHLNEKSIWFSPLPLDNSINVAILIQIVLFVYLKRVGNPNFWCKVKKISGSEKTVNCGDKLMVYASGSLYMLHGAVSP